MNRVIKEAGVNRRDMVVEYDDITEEHIVFDAKYRKEYREYDFDETQALTEDDEAQSEVSESGVQNPEADQARTDEAQSRASQREAIEVDSLEEQARILQGEPVAHIEESALDMPKKGGFKAITEWASALFERQGNATTHSKLGTIQFNEQSVRDSLAHGGFNPYKNMAFAAVRDVIREGSLVAIDGNNKGEDSFYLSAPVLMNGK